MKRASLAKKTAKPSWGKSLWMERLWDPELWCLIVIATIITTQSVAQQCPTILMVECHEVPTLPNDVSEFNEIRVNGHNADNYTLIRSWRQEDLLGKVQHHIQKIGVLDTTPPRLYFAGHYRDTVVLCAGDVPRKAVPIAIDECSGNVEVQFEEFSTQGLLPGDLDIVRRWTATDLSGNSCSHDQTIRVRDTEAPTFTQVPKDLTLPAGAQVPFEHAAAYDRCDADLTIFYYDQRSSDGQYLYRLWVARDDRNNSTSALQTIRFVQKPADQGFLVGEGAEKDLGHMLGQLKVYPNPFEGKANFEIRTTTTTDLTLSIFDLRGQLVHQQYRGIAAPSIITLEIDRELPPGTYLYVAKFDGKTVQGRMVSTR